MAAWSQSSADCWSCLIFDLKCDRQVPVCNHCCSNEEGGTACFPAAPGGAKGPSNSVVGHSPEDFNLELLDPSLDLNTPDDTMDFLHISALDTRERLDSGYAESCHDFVTSAAYSSGLDGPATATTSTSLFNLSPRNTPQAVMTKESPSARRSQAETIEPAILDAAQEAPQGEASHAYEGEMCLLMNYLDHVFHAQFRHYRPDPKQGGRNWLLSRLTSSKSVYYATLALSALHMHEDRTAGDHTNSNPGQHHSLYSTAISLLEHDVGLLRTTESPDTNMVIDASMAIVQLTCYDSWRSSVQPDTPPPYSSYFNLLSSRLSNISASSSLDSHVLSSTSDRQATKALQFVSSVFLCLEMAQAIGLSKQSPLHLCQSFASQGSGILQLRETTGCQDWATILLVEVLLLYRWKSTSQARQSLSSKELSKKAHGLEDRLIEGLASLDETVSKPGVEQTTHRTTEVFASAAMILLQVVTNGFDPGLLEIRQSVERARAAIEKVFDRSVLRQLALPIALVGSLADKSHEPFFRIVMSACRQGSSRSRATLLYVMEESWKLREQNQEAPSYRDWLHMMSACDLRLLVF